MAQKKSLIEEALSDAEEVRETALANAKAQLEEAFEPRIKSMISKQLRNETDELEYEDEIGDPLEEEEDEMDYEDEEDDEDEEMEESQLVDPETGQIADPTNADDSEIETEAEDMDDEEEDMDYEDEEEMEEGDYEDKDLDLESVIRELESEVNEEEGEDYEDSAEHGDDEGEDVIDLDELLQTIAEEEDYDEEEGEVPGEQDTGPDEYEDDEEMEESFNLDELFKALEESDDSEEELVETLTAENEKLTSENAEYREAVEILRSKLNEVNLLNAKLLYTSKLFRKYSLNNSQKMKVVESFDRTKSVRETKLVYSTLAESFRMNDGKSSGKRSRASITEGLASKPVKSTKPSKDSEIIKESNNVANRFKKLVNYNKKK